MGIVCVMTLIFNKEWEGEEKESEKEEKPIIRFGTLHDSWHVP